MDIGTTSDIDKLLVLQEFDIRIRQFDRELKDIPERKREEETRLAQHKQETAEAEKQLKLRQAAIKELELEVETCREKILKYRRQQTDIKTNKEFQASETEIKAVQVEIRGLEDKELELMALMEDASRVLDEKKRDLAAEAAIVSKDVAVWDTRAAELQKSLTAERELRAAAAVGIQEQGWLSLYQRVFSRKDRALVPVEGGVCGGCHMQLPPFVAHAVKKPTALVTCEYCGRLLYQR